MGHERTTTVVAVVVGRMPSALDAPITQLTLRETTHYRIRMFSASEAHML